METTPKMPQTTLDEQWMRHAIRLAQRAELQDEVPVGAVAVRNNLCIAEGWNQPIALHDPSAHAEMLAIRKAAEGIQNYRLVDITLYVTLEPCVMCMGLLNHARIHRLVFGAYDPKRGAVCNCLQLADTDFLNHRIAWTGGVLANQCGDLLIDFFRKRR